ncbi:MAG TPA: glycosyl hydrolase family 18 protein [Actinocrinis sp.]|nr:glycosyl hydrolase family 18 protein [Actinocrinis sp.]
MRSSRKAFMAVGSAAAVVLGTAVVLLGTGSASAAPANTTGAAATSGGIKVAYYDQWSIYQNAFYLKNLDTEGMAGKLNYLIYDFENIDPANLTCMETTKATDPDPAGENDPNAGDGAGDSFADYQKSFDSSISVDGTSDAFGMPIVGNFHQLQELEKKYPNLKVELSLGGWTYSKYFSDVAATAASRQKFVSSCIDMFIKGNIPSQGGYGGAGTAAGIFSGFDIDWEYPGGGGHLGNHASAADKQNYTLLLQEFRNELNTAGAAAGKTYTLSAALPSGQDKIADIETNNIGQYLTFGDAMTYDMYGAWNATGPTDEQDPLYANPNSPETKVAPGNETYSIDNTVRAYTVGDSAYGIPGGFPAGKLTLGVPFYYRGWTGVAAGSNHGLYQGASGPSAGMTLSGSVPGTAMYKEITTIVANSADTYWDPVTQSAYFYDGTNFYGGESAQSIQARADYLHCNGLGGAMMFSLYDLDPAATLFNATVTDVNGSSSTCPAAPPSTSASASATGGSSRSPSASASPSSSPTGGNGGTCSAPAWVSTTAYNGGAVVSYGGHTWTAKWWTQGDIPGNNGQNVWTDNGACSGGGSSASASPTGGSGTCSAPAWVSTTAYNGGAVVSYGGHTWTAKWWTQGDIPGNNGQNVWTDNGAC